MNMAGPHNKGGHQVTIAPDGSIQVKPGDSLSKYSLAMSGDFRHIHEFGRRMPAPSGPVQPVANINYIQAFETLYHIPTHGSQGNGTAPAPETPLSKADVRREVERILREDYSYKGPELAQRVDLVLNFLYYGGNINNVVRGSALGISVVGEWVRNSTLVYRATSVTTAGGIIAGLLIPISGILNIWKARSFNIRQSGIRAVVYAIVAWSFHDPLPTYPRKLYENLQQGGVTTRREAEQILDAWDQAVNQTTQSMKMEPFKTGRPADELKGWYRAGGGNHRNTMGNMLIEIVAEQYLAPGAERYNFIHALGRMPYVQPPGTNSAYPNQRAPIR